MTQGYAELRSSSWITSDVKLEERALSAGTMQVPALFARAAGQSPVLPPDIFVWDLRNTDYYVQID